MTNSFRIMRDEVVGVSPITVWEITRKVSLGKLPPIFGRWKSIQEILRAQGYDMHPLSWEDADAANTLPPHHRDPIDRMLIATALRADLTVITSDAIFRQYGIKTIW
jgi:PIN domain nuclease of toxin-antitoxin system